MVFADVDRSKNASSCSSNEIAFVFRSSSIFTSVKTFRYLYLSYLQPSSCFFHYQPRYIPSVFDHQHQLLTTRQRSYTTTTMTGLRTAVPKKPEYVSPTTSPPPPSLNYHTNTSKASQKSPRQDLCRLLGRTIQDSEELGLLLLAIFLRLLQ